MAWFKVDDAFHSSKPVLRIPRRYRAQAVGLWIMAGTWSAQEESDGFIPDYVLEELCGTPAIAAHLVRAGLWVEVTGESQEGSGVSGGPGWQFHNWSKYQPTREELEEKREKERVRKANYRMSQRDTNGTPAGRTEGHLRESDTPDPTRPDPAPIEEAKASSSKPAASSEFDAFWRDYPRKVGKEAARKAFFKALKNASFGEVMAGLETLRIQVAGKDQQYTPHPATWLNAGRWEDEVPQQVVVNGPWAREFHG